jgi:polysaccharide biosynthesis/export protein
VRVVGAFRIPIIAVVAALALSGCMRTSGPVAVAPQLDRDTAVYSESASAPPPAVTASTGSGPLNALRAAFAAPRPAAGPPVILAAPMAPVARAPMRYDAAYHLDAGDKLRVVVYGQEGLTNTYAVSAGGSITMPLIGSVMARGRTTAGLAADISAKLRAGFIREPSVAVEIEAYRPFFILGEVAAPGQYPYVPNMTAESAVAIAGGFSPRARRDRVTVTHTDASGTTRFEIAPGSPISPGDTVLVGERWF